MKRSGKKVAVMIMMAVAYLNLDELLEKARKKVGDSDLSEADRVKYYIGE